MSKDLIIELSSDCVRIENGFVTLTVGVCSNIKCINSGLPGIIGPDIDINLREILGELNEKAREKAFNEQSFESS